MSWRFLAFGHIAAAVVVLVVVTIFGLLPGATFDEGVSRVVMIGGVAVMLVLGGYMAGMTDSDR